MSSIEDVNWEAISKLTYRCARCGHTFSGEHLALRRRFVCPRCGYRVLMKVRPPIVKRLKAK